MNKLPAKQLAAVNKLPGHNFLLPGKAVNVAAKAWLTNYVTNAFPSSITCNVTWIQKVGGQYKASPAQQAILSNA